MLTNPNVLAHLPRQPNVVLNITTKEGQVESFYNRLVEVIVMSMAGNTYVEVRRFTNPMDPEPKCVTTFVNPAKWEQVGAADNLDNEAVLN